MLKIWDLPTRIYHWLQALLFFALIASAYLGIGGKDAHTFFGTVLFVLLLWRIGWGLFGSETSRFIQFLYSPKEIFQYLKNRRQKQAGHNPIGALMVIALIFSLSLQGCLGLLISDWIEGKEIFGRATIRTLKEIHGMNALLLISLSAMHITAALISWLKGQPLINAMFSGNSKAENGIQQPKISSNTQALGWLMFCIIGFAGFISLPPYL